MRQIDNLKNILFISMGGIGDVIFLTPALQIISDKFPEAQFHFLLSRSRSREIIELHPQTGSIIESTASKKEALTIITAMRKIKPDLVFSGRRTNPLNCGLLGIISKARYRLGESFGAGKILYNLKAGFDTALHAVEANMKMARVIAPGQGIPSLKIWTSESDRKTAKTFLRDQHIEGAAIGFHPGSGPAMAYKRWPLDRFIELGRMIIEKSGIKIIVFGSAEEKELGEMICNSLGSHAVNAAGLLSIRKAYEVMKICSVFISNDTGPMHLAATAKSKVIALFGPTPNTTYIPWGEGHEIITDTIDCRPCYRYKPVTCTHLSCMKNISVKQVFETFLEVMKKTK